jgi:hypothetical protein
VSGRLGFIINRDLAAVKQNIPDASETPPADPIGRWVAVVWLAVVRGGIIARCDEACFVG